VDQRALANPDGWVQSACVLCSNGCALDIAVKDGRIVGVRGREQDAVNRGRLGPKGLHGWEANNSRDRLTMPLTKSGGALQQASWNDAMSLIVERTKEIWDRATASAIGFYTSGQLMLEEYYTLAVIGKAGLGTPHMDGNTRLWRALRSPVPAQSCRQGQSQDGNTTVTKGCENPSYVLRVVAKGVPARRRAPVASAGWHRYVSGSSVLAAESGPL